MQSIEIDDDFFIPPRASSSIRGRRSSSGTFSTSPSLLVNGHGLSRKSFSYNKLPQQPLGLSVVKLDGSSFDVEVMTTATIAELKQAVESVFSHFPQKGPGKISWSHVWGQFCLCYEGQKLLIDTDSIRDYGIKDGDQLHFVRHVSIKYNLVKRQSRKRAASRKLKRIEDESLKIEQNVDDDDNDCDDLENQKCQYFEEENEEFYRHPRFKLTNFMKGWFSYTRLPSRRRKKYDDRSHSSRFAEGFVSGLRRLVRAYTERCCS